MSRKNVIYIVVSVIVLLMVMTFFVVFSNKNGNFCIGKSCLENKVDISENYQKFTEGTPMLIRSYREYAELAIKDKAFAEQVDLDEGNFRKNDALVFSIEHNGCGVYTLTSVRVLGKTAIAYFSLGNKDTCLDDKYYVYKTIEKDVKIDRIDSYYIEMKN